MERIEAVERIESEQTILGSQLEEKENCLPLLDRGLCEERMKLESSKGNVFPAGNCNDGAKEIPGGGKLFRGRRGKKGRTKCR